MYLYVYIYTHLLRVFLPVATFGFLDKCKDLKSHIIIWYNLLTSIYLIYTIYIYIQYSTVYQYLYIYISHLHTTYIYIFSLYNIHIVSLCVYTSSPALDPVAKVHHGRPMHSGPARASKKTMSILKRREVRCGHNEADLPKCSDWIITRTLDMMDLTLNII